MHKDIDIKHRVVNMYDADTGKDEDEIIKYLDKQMKVRFHSVYFSALCKTQFLGTPTDQVPNSITVNKYCKKHTGDNAVIIK